MAHSSKSGRAKILMFSEQHGLCFYCWKVLTLQSATADHVLPWSHGGGNDINNIVVACSQCNGSRGDMPATEFAEYMRLKMKYCINI